MKLSELLCVATFVALVLPGSVSAASINLSFTGVVDNSGATVGGVAAPIGSSFSLDMVIDDTNAVIGQYVIQSISYTTVNGTYVTIAASWAKDLLATPVGPSINLTQLGGFFEVNGTTEHFGMNLSNFGASSFDNPLSWNGAAITGDIIVRGIGGFASPDQLSGISPFTGTLSVSTLPREFFDKEITDGNDYDDDGAIDLAVEVGIETQSTYDFKINYNQPSLPPVQIEDTVPAEWQVMGLENDNLNCEFTGANKKDNGKSATMLACLPESTEGEVTVLVDARCHDSRNNKKCRPTSCGALYLNNGAAAYEIDPDTGEPVLDDEGDRLPPLLETNSLCLVAVSDLNGGGIDYTGNGDEDGDEMPDWFEACEIGTDPCDPDSDDDGYDDYIDDCPLEGPADPALGEILGEDGCIHQSQCSDGLDNEPDGSTDFPDDASCDDILDDSEDTVDSSSICGIPTPLEEGLCVCGFPEIGCYEETFTCESSEDCPDTCGGLPMCVLPGNNFPEECGVNNSEGCFYIDP